LGPPAPDWCQTRRVRPFDRGAVRAAPGQPARLGGRPSSPPDPEHEGSTRTNLSANVKRKQDHRDRVKQEVDGISGLTISSDVFPGPRPNPSGEHSVWDEYYAVVS